jgi:hypothetical protein
MIALSSCSQAGAESEDSMPSVPMQAESRLTAMRQSPRRSHATMRSLCERRHEPRADIDEAAETHRQDANAI